MALSPKHQAFVDAYLQSFNATDAYSIVYQPKSRASAAVNGHKLLRNTKIADAISIRLQEKAMGADEVLMRLADTARSDLGPYMSDDGEVDIAAMKKAGKTHLIRKIERTVRTGTSKDGGTWEHVTAKIELHDAKDAQKLIGQHHRLFADRVELTGKDGKDLQTVTHINVYLPDNGRDERRDD